MQFRKFVLLLVLICSVSVFAQNKVQQIDSVMSLYHDYRMFNGTVMVAENGDVIFKKGYGLANMDWDIPNQPDVKFRIGSITKQFTAMLIMQQVEAGNIKLENKIVDYLPDYRKDTGSKITVHHLLTHSSGLPNYTSLPGFWSDSTRNRYTKQYIVKRFCSGDLEFEPGSKYRYCNSGYFILGVILEKVTGKTFKNLLEEKILQPLNMQDSGMDDFETIIEKRATGYQDAWDHYERAPYIDMINAYAAGAMYSTVEDLYLWDQALYAEKLLPNKFKKQLFNEHIETNNGHYGYGWAINYVKLAGSDDSVRVVEHGGGIHGFNTLITRLVSDKHLIVLMNNTGGANLQDMRKNIVNVLYERDYQEPVQPIARVIYKSIKENDVEGAIDKYWELKKNSPDKYDFAEFQLNRLGYQLLSEKKVDAAISIFKLNVKVYPEAYNTYDSLGEGYMIKGEKERAIKNYAKSLELNPNNTNAVRMLQRLM